jgi:(p)ppGpp synthase/HD superfamily hydrolase
MANLQRALEIAVESHKNQKQKDGTPYALHPIRLSMSLQSEEQKIVALLHDVVEDTDWTFEDLVGEGFSENVIEAFRLLTQNDGLPYEGYVELLAPIRGQGPSAYRKQSTCGTDALEFHQELFLH